MRSSSKVRQQLRLANISFVLLFLAAVGLLQWLSQEYHLKFDWTQNGRHSLSEASISAIEQLQGPIKITAFASKRGGQRKQINELIERYRQHKSDIELEFVDPDTEPERVREADIRFDGQLLIEYGGAKETLTQRTEETLTNALTRLGHRGERWLVFIEGHGERSPDRRANFDLSSWADQLRKRGFKTRSVKLAETPKIPDNTTALVIAGPQARLLKGEVEAIRKYVDRGGNLLWLGDPGPLRGLAPLAEQLGVEFQPGLIVDPASQLITGSASAVVVTNYNNHPIVKNFNNLTLFPNAVGIRYQAPEGWKAAVVLDTRESAWSETRSKGAVKFDKGKDIPGPLNLAVALTRERKEDAEQRVLIVGDGDFLSNTYLGNGGNLDLGLSMVNWISRDDAYVSIPVRTAVDRSLYMSRAANFTIVGVFLIGLPIGLIASGVVIWLRRRKR